jgi:anti-anti-sigma factor
MEPWPTNRARNSSTARAGADRETTLMKFELREASPGYLILTGHGGLSWEDRELLSAGVEQYLVGCDTLHGVAFDMAHIQFVNSAGLGALFQLVQRVRSRGGGLAFVNVPPAIRRLLSTVGMERLAKFADSVPEALKLLAGVSKGSENAASPSVS